MAKENSARTFYVHSQAEIGLSIRGPRYSAMRVAENGISAHPKDE